MIATHFELCIDIYITITDSQVDIDIYIIIAHSQVAIRRTTSLSVSLHEILHSDVLAHSVRVAFLEAEPHVASYDVLLWLCNS